jgi:dethiobiotin synthetase
VFPAFPFDAPGLFVTGTDTDVGKTFVAAAIADALRLTGRRVAVLKPVATGCVRRREGLVSEDAELLAAAADTPQPLDLICPNRYAEPLAPSVAARRSGRPVDYDAIGRSIVTAGRVDGWVVEGAGGLFVPLDRQRTILDLLVAMRLPALVVATPRLGTINHTLLTVAALRAARVHVAGVVLNRYPAGTPTTAEETAAAEIEQHGRVPVLAYVPQEDWTPPALPAGVRAAVGRVDWPALLRRPG